MFACAQQAAQQAGLDLRKEPDGLVLSGDGMTLRVDFCSCCRAFVLINSPENFWFEQHV